jgi:hypothetical protein
MYARLAAAALRAAGVESVWALALRPAKALRRAPETRTDLMLTEGLVGGENWDSNQ